MRKVGVEEELLLVDPSTGQLSNVAGAVLARHEAVHDDDEPADAHVDHELLQHMVETRSDPSTDLDEIGRQLRGARLTAISTAAEVDVAVAAVGMAPLPGDGPQVTPDTRYGRIVQEFGETGLNAGSLGMHVHVDVSDDEEAVRVIDGIRPWLPVLVAVSANSPYARGVDTGYATWRQQVWSRWPTAGQSEPFGSVEEYRRVAESLVGTGAALDNGMLYFDARLADEYSTVEIRVCDACTDLDDALLVTALARALVETIATEQPDGSAWRSDLLRGAHWRAARHGLAGQLVHPVAGVLAPAIDVVDALVDHVRPALAEAGDEDRVATALARLSARGNGATAQRRAFERSDGDVAAVVHDLVTRTRESAEDRAG